MSLANTLCLICVCACSPAPVATSAPPTPSAPTVDLVIGEKDIRDGHGTTIMELPADRSKGVDARFKRNGAIDLYVVALEATLKSIKPHAPADVLRIDVARTTPYRLLVEVLYTAGMNEWTGYDLRILGAPARHVVTHPPRVAGNTPGLGLTLIAVRDGISIKARGGNVAPGCEDTGPGLAIPTKGGHHDFSAMGACVAKLKTYVPEEEHVTVSANPEITFETVLSMIESASMFPEVSFGIAR